jgi:hypothetical protein
MIRVYDESGDVIETHEHKAISKNSLDEENRLSISGAIHATFMKRLI